MKAKLPLLSAVAFIFTCGVIVAQNNTRTKTFERVQKHDRQASRNNVVSKTSSTGCGANIIDYVYYKEEVGLDANNTFDTIPVWPGEMASTAFPNSHPVTISQLMFSGKLSAKSKISSSNKATLGLWTVEPGTFKPKTLLSSATVAITKAGSDYYVATLATPISISETFAVTISNATVKDTIEVFMTDPSHSATQELLSFYNYQGFWETMPASNYIETEIVLMPVISYNLEANFQTGGSTVCSNKPVAFSNMSSTIFDSPVFNLFQFKKKWLGATFDSTYAWDFGDGSAVVFEKNPTHTFTTAGTYNVSLTGSTQGYFFTTCSDTKTMTITVKDDVVSSFSIDSSQSPKITFTNTSSNSETSTVYSWIFGDGTVSNDANPFHSYTAGGPYTVTLVATGPCGTSTSMKNIVISKVTGINQFTPLTVITRYDQYGKNLTVSLSELPSSMGQISVYSLQGKLIASESMNTLSKTIHLGNIAAGSYIVRVQTPNGFGATRIAVTE